MEFSLFTLKLRCWRVDISTMKVDGNFAQAQAAAAKAIDRGFEGVEDVASSVARASVDQQASVQGLTADMVALVEYRNLVQAATQAFSATNEALESLLDSLG